MPEHNREQNLGLVVVAVGGDRLVQDAGSRGIEVASCGSRCRRVDSARPRAMRGSRSALAR